MLQTFAGAVVQRVDSSSLPGWSRDDLLAMIAYMRALDAGLRRRGELFADYGFNGPSWAHTVQVGDGGEVTVAPGLRPGATEYLVGCWFVDVASLERAIEIAAEISLTPGPGGLPVRQVVEIHPIGSAPDVV
jgi:hypothetical protein